MPTDTLRSTTVLLVGTADWVGAVADALTDTGASVRRAETAEAALERFQEGSIDCILTGYELTEATGLEVVRSVRQETETVPVLLCTASGSEAIASDAIAAGVSDYIVIDEQGDSADDILGRIERSIRTAREDRTRQDRARQFDAMFRDTRTAVWVLQPNGTVSRVNRTAREMVDIPIENATGRRFWALPWWPEASGTREDVRRIIETAMEGSFGNAVVMGTAGEAERVIDLSARPVRDEQGTIVSIVVEAVDITERADLERDLRRSEELHRVTLNNMTDTVLITDESGEYTYVCPNVHFIFGYTVEEIRQLGPIDELLGPELFDREELAEEGVLKNIECTATDKAGREHTLLVNVREVSIQDGTFLYSCRDITKRKQREEALATLQETARDFLYAETHSEIAQHVVDDTPGVLDVDASTVYLFDADENDLDPVVYASAMERLNGPPRTVHANDGGLISYSFVEDEPLFFDDIHDSDRLGNEATDIRSAAFIPLGEHGVFFAGSDSVGAFDDVTRELADLLAATAEAALDRVTRESRLREQDRELQRRNDQLTALNRINETIREIDQALVEAETREEIDHTVCELLTDDDRFAFAWVGSVDPRTDTIAPQAWAGAEQGYLDSRTFSAGETSGEPVGRAAATREVTMVSNVAAGLREEAWRKDALSRDYLSVLSIPLLYNDVSYGVLTVYARTQNAFDETARAVIAELGETIAAAVSAIDRKNALLTTSMTSIEMHIDDSQFVLSRLAAEADCTLSYQGGVQQTADGSYVFVTVEDAPIEAVEGAALELHSIETVQRISTDGVGGVLRLGLSRPFLAIELADHGAVLRSVSTDGSETTLVVDIPESIDVRHITGFLGDTFGEVRLQSKQTFDRSTERDLYARVFDRLTDRQLEVVQTAYYSGFFDSPRESTGEEVAETLGISSTAFYNHIRAVQRTLFEALFDDIGVPAARSRAGG